MKKLLTALIFLIGIVSYGQSLNSVNKRIMVDTIRSKVPYTGAIKSVDLGAEDLTTTGSVTAGSLVTNGSDEIVFSTTAATSVTLPTSGTLATTDDISASVLGDTILTSADQTRMQTSANWKANTSYEIRDSLNMGGNTIDFPAGVTLKFNGGLLANGTLQGENTVFISNGKKIFDSSITFTGSWQTNKVTPQDFGAKTNVAYNTIANECSWAIQAAVNSPFQVDIPAGYYYVADTIIVTKPVTITTVGYIDRPVTNAEGARWEYEPNHTAIYTDQSIPVFFIQTGQFNFLGGGLIDFSPLSTSVGIAFQYDFDIEAMLWGNVEATINGHKTGLKPEGLGPIGVLFDTLGVTNNGYAYWQKFDLVGKYCNKVFWVKDYWASGDGNDLADFDVKISAFGCKQAAVIESFNSEINLDVVGQSQTVLDVAERYYPFVQIDALNGGRLNLEVFDFDGAEGGGYYANSVKLDNNSEDLVYSEKTVRTLGTETSYYQDDSLGYRPRSYQFIENPTFLNINNGVNRASLRGPGISKLENILFYRKTIYPTTTWIRAYDGSAVDFDTFLEPSHGTVPVEPLITISDTTAFFIPNPLAYPYISFTDASTLAAGYVEMVIPWGARLQQLNYCLNMNDMYFDRIQTIQITSTDTTSYDWYPESAGTFTYFPSIDEDVTTVKLIIRFIGSSAEDEVTTFYDFFATTPSSNFTPYVHLGGGQTIYGDVTIDNGGELKFPDSNYGINFAGGDVTFRRSSSNCVEILGGSLYLQGNLYPKTNDVGGLGFATLGWSDLFFASGAVTGWNNGDVTLTHATNKLSLEGGFLDVAQLSGSLTDGTPTDAEIDAVTGTTPAAVTAGWQCTIKDSDGTGLLYRIESDGTNWFYVVMTKAL